MREKRIICLLVILKENRFKAIIRLLIAFLISAHIPKKNIKNFNLIIKY